MVIILNFCTSIYTSDLASACDEEIVKSMREVVKLGPDWKKNKWYRFAQALDGKDEVAYVNTMQIGDNVKNNKGRQPENYSTRFWMKTISKLSLLIG